MYDLFVLGELCDGNMHGYLLHEILTRVLGPTRTVSWGTFYPILKRLEDQGLIEPVPGETPAGARPKKDYGITESGRAHFLDLMGRPLEHNDEAEDIFRIKLAKFHLVPGRVRGEILAQYQSFVRILLAGVEDAAVRVKSESRISAAECPDILQALEYQAHTYAARLDWLGQKIDGGDWR